MAIQFVTFDDKDMKPGKFYDIRINKDLSPALIEAPPSPLHFTDIKYLKEQLTTNHSLEIWEIREYNGKQVHFNITYSVEWFIEHPENTLTVFSNTPITGYIKFI